jgi:hypothetical protein
MKYRPLFAAFACTFALHAQQPGAAAAPAAAAAATPEAVRTYEIRQTVNLAEVPAGTKLVRWWIAIPNDDPAQKVLDFAVTSAPGDWRVEREPGHGNRFLYVEIPNPKDAKLTATIDFTVRREPILFELDPAKAKPITDMHRKLYAADVATDAPHMEVTAEIKKIADEVCGKDLNVVSQIRALQNYVANFADHYSKDPSKPKCGVGTVTDCMANKGGCCTDLHSLYIALARARGIPARLQMGYRVLAKNVDKEVDPGYRCWPETFVPGYGWVPADLVEADAVALGDALRLRWMNGMSERRVWLNEGREFELKPRQDAPGRVNTMIIGYAEIDGKPARVLPEGDKAAQLSRTVRFTERPAGEPAPLLVAK